MNILIVEDDVPTANFLRRLIRQIPIVNILQMAHTFEDGFDKALTGVFDLVLLDICLGKSEFCGIDLCRSIRKGNPNVFIVMVTAMKETKSLEEAFAVGANDYIAKPFRPKELQLRVQRYFMLQHQTERLYEEISYKELSFDPQKNEFTYQGERLSLSKKNKVLLLLLLKNKEQMISHQNIREKFWGDYPGSERGRNVRSNIHLLRKALPDPCCQWIRAVPGEGFIFEESA